jgi:DNA-binding NarL/FixJ family response regulator
MIRVLIVDDHTVVRQGLRFMLERQQDISVVGESGDGKQAVALAADLIPEVVLLDLLMPRMALRRFVRSNVSRRPPRSSF